MCRLTVLATSSTLGHSFPPSERKSLYGSTKSSAVCSRTYPDTVIRLLRADASALCSDLPHSLQCLALDIARKEQSLLAVVFAGAVGHPRLYWLQVRNSPSSQRFEEGRR